MYIYEHAVADSLASLHLCCHSKHPQNLRSLQYLFFAPITYLSLVCCILSLLLLHSGILDKETTQSGTHWSWGREKRGEREFHNGPSVNISLSKTSLKGPSLIPGGTKYKLSMRRTEN